MTLNADKKSNRFATTTETKNVYRCYIDSRRKAPIRSLKIWLNSSSQVGENRETSRHFLPLPEFPNWETLGRRSKQLRPKNLGRFPRRKSASQKCEKGNMMAGWPSGVQFRATASGHTPAKNA